MSCPHCETIRAQQRAFLDELGCADWNDYDRLPSGRPQRPLDETGEPLADWNEPPWRKTLPSWLPPSSPPMRDCPCDCHAVARIGGALPRLRP